MSEEKRVNKTSKMTARLRKVLTNFARIADAIKIDPDRDGNMLSIVNRHRTMIAYADAGIDLPEFSLYDLKMFVSLLSTLRDVEDGEDLEIKTIGGRFVDVKSAPDNASFRFVQCDEDLIHDTKPLDFMTDMIAKAGKGFPIFTVDRNLIKKIVDVSKRIGLDEWIWFEYNSSNDPAIVKIYSGNPNADSVKMGTLFTQNIALEDYEDACDSGFVGIKSELLEGLDATRDEYTFTVTEGVIQAIGTAKKDDYQSIYFISTARDSRIG